VVAGYAVSSVVRPLIALATSVAQVVAVRVLDRLGKGVRTSPRDALLAATVPASERGAAFGFHRGMDHAGAALGPLLAAGLLAAGISDLRIIFALAAIPALVAVLVALAVHEAPVPVPVVATAAVERPPVRLRRVLVPFFVFALGNASDTFLLLQAGASNTPLVALPLLWTALHAVKSATSLLGGALADRFGRRRTIACGWLVYAAVYIGLAHAETPGAVAALFVTYGLYSGLTEGPERALIAELAPAKARGTAFGWFHMTLGAAGLAASVLFGGLWEAYGSKTAFLTSAALAGAALLLLPLSTTSPSSPLR
jgi:MFS family permease